MDNKISCKKCTKCGFINISSNGKCDKCSNDLSEVEIAVYDSFPKQYVQVCPACTCSNYTDNTDVSIKICFNCQKGRISKIPLKEYIETKNTDEHNDLQEQLLCQVANNQNSFIDDIKQKKVDIEYLQKKHEEDEVFVGWENILDIKSEIKKITLTSKAYGNVSFSITSDEKKYMLGRSANQGVFLSQDRRVGNEHCYIFFEDDYWFVKDNNSKNGTFVNSKDIGINGVHILKNGFELKLGHNDDSVAFDIIIE